MTTVQEELTYLNLVADLESEAETPCESAHRESICSQKVLWRVTPPCSCSARLMCQNAYDYWLFKSHKGAFRCDACNTTRMLPEDFIWRAV